MEHLCRIIALADLVPHQVPFHTNLGIHFFFVQLGSDFELAVLPCNPGLRSWFLLPLLPFGVRAGPHFVEP